MGPRHPQFFESAVIVALTGIDYLLKADELVAPVAKESPEVQAGTSIFLVRKALAAWSHILPLISVPLRSARIFPR